MATKYLTKGNDGNSTTPWNNDGSTNNFSSVFGLAGNDYLKTAISSSIYGGDGNDTITSTLANASNKLTAAYRDYLFGGNGNDSISSTGGANDQIFGGNGNDTIASGDGQDIVHGDAGNDSITGGIGNQQLYGDVGNDTVTGGQGNQSLFGGVGNDSVSAGIDANTLTGAAVDNHWVYGGDGNDTVTGGAATTVAANTFHLYGGAGNDSILGSAAGKDTMNGGTGINTITGGATGHANETVSFYDNAAGAQVGTTAFYKGVVVDMSLTTAQNVWTLTGAATITDTITGVDNLNGSLFNDTLSAGANGGTINAYSGNDVINGYSTASNTANESIFGGAGNDTIKLFDGTQTQDSIDGGTGNGAGSGVGADVLDFSGSTTAGAISGTATFTVVVAGTSTTGDTIILPTFQNSGDPTLQSGTALGTITGVYANLSNTIDSNGVLNFAGSAGSGAINSIEKVIGTANADVLVAGGNNSTIDGGAGNDTLVSASNGSGYDVLLGGGGTNVYDGTENAFKDYFGVGNATGENDTIYGFNGTQGDKLYVSIAAWSAAGHALTAGATGDYTATTVSGVTTYGLNANAGAEVVVNATAALTGNAASAAGHGDFLLNSSTGNLYWQASGAITTAVLLGNIDQTSGWFASAHASGSAILDQSDFILVA